MNAYDTFIATVFIAAVALLLIVGVPACLDKQHHTALRCLELRPNASISDCGGMR